jgi:hypothetical protein
MSARRMAIENYADESYIKEFNEQQTDEFKPKSPEEIKTLIQRYGAERLVRAMGKFKGSTMAIHALGVIMKQGGDSAVQALEYIANGLKYASEEVSSSAYEELIQIKDPDLISKLIGLMEDDELAPKILEVLKKIDHPDARQVVESED